MDIKTAGKNMNIGQAFQQYMEEELQKVVSKYFQQSIDANSVVSKEAHLFRTNIHILVGTGRGLVIKGEGQAGDPYVSFDNALSKIAKQLRRYKKRIQNHNHTSAAEAADILNAREYVLTPEHDAAEEQSHTVDGQQVPVVIAETKREVETMPVRTAVMRMDLEDAPMYIFRNEGSNHINVIYRREDGNIGWIDPEKQNGKQNGKAAKAA